MLNFFYRESIFSKVSIKVVLAFCVMVIFTDIWRLLSISKEKLLAKTNLSWILIFIGVLFFVNSVIKKQWQERVGFGLLGISFFVDGSYSILLPTQIWLILFVGLLVLKFLGTISLWFAYQKYTLKAVKGKVR